MTRGSPGRIKRTLFALLIGGVSSTMGLLVVETYARRIERRVVQAKMRAPGLSLLQTNPSGAGSHRLIPNIDVVTRVKGVEVHIRTNRHGMAWRDMQRRKPPRMKRVAFLGDSFTFGCWASSFEEAFPAVFERGLNRRRFEVLNFGVGGYGLDDMELLLREETLSFSPDWVFVMLFAGNDFRDTLLGLDKHAIVAGTARLREAAFDAARVPELQRNAFIHRSPLAPDPSWLRRKLKRSATFRLLLPRLHLDYLWVDFKVSQRLTWFTFWSQHPPLPIMLTAKDAVVATLSRMNAVARANGARLVVVTIPFHEQVVSLRESGSNYDIHFPQAWVRVHCRERGIPYLDLLPLLRAHVRSTNRDGYVEDDIHFDTYGHRLVGRWLRDWFVREVQPLGRIRLPE